MANPQPTPFVRFSKELFEAFYLNPPATVAMVRLWLWVFRMTWADFGKEETAPRSYAQVAAEVGGSSRGSVCRDLQSLVRCRRLKIGKNGGYAIQKDYDQWREDPMGRKAHWGTPRARQELLFTPVDNLGIVSHGETPDVSHGETKVFPTVKPSVSPSETPIRSKNTVKNNIRVKGPSEEPNGGRTDTPRTRAEVGDPERPPEEHPSFKYLDFDRKKELTAQWTATRAKRLCRNGCGRAKLTDAWGYCRLCTVCHSCKATTDSGRKFQKGPGGVLCGPCADDMK